MEPTPWCDMSLLNGSLSYHGDQLFNELQTEQHINFCGPLGIRSNNNQTDTTRHIPDEFNRRLVKFIARKADLIFSRKETLGLQSPVDASSNAENNYVVLPPIEHFMNIPKAERKQHFFNSIEKENVLIGTVTAIQDTGLTLTILTVEIGKIRDTEQLKLTAFCPLREIPKTSNHDDVLDSYNVKDKVRVVVLNVQDEKLTVSMQTRNLPTNISATLGLVNDEDLPLHYRRLQESLSFGGKTYESYLCKMLEFHNPGNVSNLTSMFSIDDTDPPSLMRGLFRVKYNTDDYADKLRQGQSYRLAMISVGEGVKYFKKGQQLEAMQLLNRALQIDRKNIEALVARGALYANCESYRRAIEDFEEALHQNPNHVNAKKYLIQTLVAFAHSLVDDDTELAASCVNRVLDLDPNDVETISLSAAIQKRLKSDRKVSPTGNGGDSERDSEERRSSVIEHAKETLLKMIQEDKDERSGKRKSRTLSHEESVMSLKKSKTEFEQQMARNLSPESQKFVMAMTAGLDPPPEHFGPALPPPPPSAKRHRKANEKLDKSSTPDSASSSSSSSTSSSNSSKHSNSDRSRSMSRGRISKDSKKETSKSPVDRKNSRKTEEQTKRKSRVDFERREKARNDKDRSKSPMYESYKRPDNKRSESRQLNNSYHEERRRTPQKNINNRKCVASLSYDRTFQKRTRRSDSDDRRTNFGKDSKPNSRLFFGQRSSLGGYSSERNRRESANLADKTKEEEKEASASKKESKGETLEDLEDFLKQLKANKQAANK